MYNSLMVEFNILYLDEISDRIDEIKGLADIYRVVIDEFVVEPRRELDDDGNQLYNVRINLIRKQ